MELLRCTQCKGDIVLSDNGLVGHCKFCGATYHFKQQKSERIISLLNQANISRLKGDYDSAVLAYQIAIKEDETDADAYWGVVLSTFGIDYVEDKTGEKIPTCRRTIKHSIFDDQFYKNAIKYADEQQAKEYAEQAQKIDTLQQNIKQKINFESDFDVFVCFKSSNEDGSPTKDRVVARKIFDQLQSQNIKTFFSEVTLKNRLGQDYEPIIYKALYTCKFFVLVVTDVDFLQAPWVRNEWTRFRDRAIEEGLEDRTITVFENLKEMDLPPIFRKQGIDLQKYPAGGYEIEICDAIKLKLEHNQPAATYNQDQIVDIVDKKLQGTRETFKERLDRATGYFDIGEKQKAIDILEQTIDMYPRKSQGWWTMTKFLTDNFLIDPLQIHGTALETKINYNFENAKRFASSKELKTYQNQSAQFFSKLENFEKIDQICNSYNHDLALLYNQSSAERYAPNPKKQKTIQQNIAINNKKISQLNKQLANKNYYIKNLPKQFGGFAKFSKFLGLLCIMFSILYTTISVIVDLQTANSKIYIDSIVGVLLFALGLSPYFLANWHERNKRIEKMADVIKQDEQLLQTLQQQNQQYQTQLETENTQSVQVDSALKQNLENNIAITQQRLQALAQFDYLKQYMEYKLHNQDVQTQQQIDSYKNYVQQLEQESDALSQTNIKKIDFQIASAPKYYNQNFEKQQKKSDKYLKENQQYIDIIDNEIENKQELINFELFKNQNNILRNILNEQTIDAKNIDKIQKNNDNLDEDNQNSKNVNSDDNNTEDSKPSDDN